jgi:hypothetical protein
LFGCEKSLESVCEKLATGDGNTFIRGTSATMAMDRWFSEALAQLIPDATSKEATE